MIAGISKEIWEKITPRLNPFLKYAFFEALQSSGCIGPKAGWLPIAHLTQNQDAALYTFAKNHSYGEYIFDWGWADAFAKYGLAYYPKLTSMVPFTPATSAHFLMAEFDESKASELISMHEALYLKEDFSSTHFLFLTPEEIPLFHQHGYMIRESMQYHFFNEAYSDFEHFLSHLKGRKAKQIRHEREHAGLSITSYTQDSLTEDHARRMYQFYISTIESKNSHDYLNEAFFTTIFKTLKNNILYVEATSLDSPVAGALFFYDEEKLYGRYWGSSEFYEKLHFELCYYQGIDFCLKHKLKVFEAGAQGQHKIARGFKPIRTYSAHKIKHPAFKEAIENFIQSEKQQIAYALSQDSESLPFSSKGR
jgi:predicted N-acyltransferase